MRGINKAIVLGTLGKDPVIRETSSGVAVAHFSVATGEKYKGEEKTTWHNIIAYSKTAELCRDYLAKGMKVYIEGRMEHGQYENKDKVKVNSFNIIADKVVFVESVKKQEAAPDPDSHNGAGDFDDDIPF